MSSRRDTREDLPVLSFTQVSGEKDCVRELRRHPLNDPVVDYFFVSLSRATTSFVFHNNLYINSSLHRDMVVSTSVSQTGLDYILRLKFFMFTKYIVQK